MQSTRVGCFGSLMLLAVLLQGSVRAGAQSVTIQNVNARVSYYRMPDEPLDPALKTYRAELDVLFRDISAASLSKEQLIDAYLVLEGYQEVAMGGDVQILAGIGEFFVWGEFRKVSRYKVKGRQVLKYYLEVKYSQPVSVRVQKQDGTTLLDRYIFSRSETRTWISPSYERSSDLDVYWRGQKSGRLGLLQKDMILEGMREIRNLVNNVYGFRRVDDRIHFEAIGRKNHPEYNRYLQQAETLRRAFGKMDADKAVDVVRSEAEPALDFFANAVTRIPAGGKDAIRLKHICMYNLATAYFWLEDFDRAETLAHDMLQTEGKDKDARRLLDNIDNTRASLQRAGRSSRHVLPQRKT